LTGKYRLLEVRRRVKSLKLSNLSESTKVLDVSKMKTAFSEDIIVALRQQPEEKSLNLQCTKNKLPNTAQITNSEKEHENND